MIDSDTEKHRNRSAVLFKCQAAREALARAQHEYLFSLVRDTNRTSPLSGILFQFVCVWLLRVLYGCRMCFAGNAF